MKLIRHLENPILKPNLERWWEAEAVFNCSVVRDQNGIFHMLFRALSTPLQRNGDSISISSIGYAKSEDGIHFKDRRFFFGPEYGWERYACEDPRITYFDGKYYVFYTAVSTWPPHPEGVKVALATTKNFDDYEKHGVITPFNAKSMALFPEKINEKIVVIFAYNPDIPPSRVVIAYFDSINDLINPPNGYWKNWLMHLEQNTVFKAEPPQKFVEVGAPPIKTDKGWILIYPDITPDLVFRINAMLLNLENPCQILATFPEPILIPEIEYEMQGKVVPKIAFPSGAVVKDGQLYVYYGASDKYCCLAICELEKLLNRLLGVYLSGYR
jgi:predicted GH43/DUF377 family glycosyl hydrolase